MPASTIRVLPFFIAFLSSCWFVGGQADAPVDPGLTSPDTQPSQDIFDEFSANRTARPDFGQSSILCRNSQDVLKESQFSINDENTSCVSVAFACLGAKMQNCVNSRLSTSEYKKASQDCWKKHQIGSNIPSREVSGKCRQLVMLSLCDMSRSGCTTCESSIDIRPAFDKNCTSSGGKLCSQSYVAFGHKIRVQTFCAPSQCSSQLLSTSLAKVYAMHSPSAEEDEPFPEGAFDNLITCGSGSEEYSARSSDYSTSSSSCHPSQTAGFPSLAIAVFSAGTALGLF